MSDLPTIDGRVLGCLPPRDDFGGRPKFSTASRVIPRGEWQDVSLVAFLAACWNQGSIHGSCVGHGSGMAYHAAYRIAGGTVPPGGFSPTSLYSQINNDRDAGAVVSDAMDALIQTGIGLMSEVPETVIYEQQISPQAKATRARFKAFEAYHVATFDSLCSAIQLGFPVSFGIAIRSGFMSPGTDGRVPTGGRVIGGHCMMAYGVQKQSNGDWGVLVRNSWGERWGNAGNCILTEAHFDQGGELDAFALCASLADPQDPNQPPVAA